MGGGAGGRGAEAEEEALSPLGVEPTAAAERMKALRAQLSWRLLRRPGRPGVGVGRCFPGPMPGEPSIPSRPAGWSARPVYMCAPLRARARFARARGFRFEPAKAPGPHSVSVAAASASPDFETKSSVGLTGMETT